MDGLLPTWVLQKVFTEASLVAILGWSIAGVLWRDNKDQRKQIQALNNKLGEILKENTETITSFKAFLEVLLGKFR